MFLDPFRFRERMHRQCMDTSCELVSKNLIDPSMPLDKPQPIKLISYQDDLEVAFRTGRHVVILALVNDFKMFDSQVTDQLPFNL